MVNLREVILNNPIVTLERADGICFLTVNNPPVNTINAEVRSALSGALDQIEKEQGTRAVVLMCAGSTFFSGADIGEFSGPPKEVEYRRLFNRIEGLAVPVIAVMHGTVLGGGLEIALACHYRLAESKARFGLPEVTLGIIPGAGGTQRMPRLIGVEKTLELMISARPVDAETAQRMGFVDRVVEGDRKTAAVAFARGAIERGTRRTGESSVDPASATPEIIERARAQARKQYPHRTAALTAIEAVSASTRLPFAQGLEYETQLVNEAKATTESKAAVHAFFAERATRNVPGLPPGTQPRPVKAAGVVGSGTMGGGIAICFANAGIPVTVVDANAEALKRGIDGVAATYDSMVKRGRLTGEEKARRMELITGSLRYEDLGRADVIIEAVFEDLALKQGIFRTLDRVARAGAILATNTSSLNINDIAGVVSRPQDVIGLHFFSPANVMPLLEVVRTDTTSPDTIRTALDLARPLKKTPVLARVCYGFIGNRMMEGYAREAQRIVLEGATPRQVDQALENFGMAMGILAVFDMAGIDVGVKVHRANADKYPPDPAYYQADVALFEAGRLGQKTGAGYYRYVPGDRSRHDDPAAIELIRSKARELGVEQREHTEAEIIERCIYPLLNEGFKILEEGIALRAADIDVVWTAGYGFPRWRGGPMFYAETIGLKTLLDGLAKYQGIYGPMHWRPSKLLSQLVREGGTLKTWEEARAGGTA